MGTYTGRTSLQGISPWGVNHSMNLDTVEYGVLLCFYEDYVCWNFGYTGKSGGQGWHNVLARCKGIDFSCVQFKCNKGNE